MDNERTADMLQVALASYDRKELRVQKNYLEEQNPVLACTCFLNGHKLLQELQQGHNFDIVVLCSQMEDMSSIEFMMELRKLEHKPLLMLFDEGRRKNSSALRMEDSGSCCCVERMELKNLLRELYRMPGQQWQRTEQQCQQLYHSWGIRIPDINCSYLTSAVGVVYGTSQKLAIRKEILQAVSEQYGVSVSAVDSGIRRMIDQLEAKPAEGWTQAIPQQAVEDACFHSLGLIGRNCEYLEQHLARVGADAQSLQAVSDISAATAKLERTINELLSALEFLRAGQPPKLYPLDLCELLQQVAAQADMVRAQLGVTLELDYGGWTTCRVLADRDDVELLCLHLLSNALRACREGGTVRILLRRSETMWQLTVRDNGCGLPEGSQEAWLENRRSFLGGAQLGLLLCRECCRRMGWGLSVECAPEKGTQAVVTVPLYTDDGRAPEVELHAGADLASEQHQYQLRAMLVRELRTMPERGDPDE